MILAIIQARMSSQRLPGKVMKEVLGKPLIGHMIDRVSRCQRIDKLLLATSDSQANDELCDYVSGLGLHVFRGSEDDVLDRFYRAAQPYEPDAVVRLTGDCPVIDPAVCARVIDTYLAGGVDYAHTGPTFADGLDCEICSFTALGRMWREARLRSEREHVLMYLHNHPELFRKATLVNLTDDSRYRLTVDEPQDLELIEAVFEHFHLEKKPDFDIEDIKGFLATRADLAGLNAHIERNAGLKTSLLNDSEVVR